ncbi:NADPH dehydrogenase [Auriculariales sp. MPI-PUGE-AT-0066]|nr:NADPH dehydrogenase [Auriculariales sp. MPI-PUGE-AT-0066]
MIPTQVGSLKVAHRIAMAPLTRFRADAESVHGDLAVQYYGQRASTPGTLLVSESTFIAECASGVPHMPGIWSPAQIEGWKKVTSEVHAKGSFIFCQLYATGRGTFREALPPQHDIISSGDIPVAPGMPIPRPLSLQEIDEYVELFHVAAKNALSAGFDGVEIHSNHGCLLDQFIQTNANNRTDEYGGSAKNRIRFIERVVRAVSETIGVERTAIRVSPYESFLGMRMPDVDLKETYNLLLTKLAPLGLAYISITEPRVSGQMGVGADDGHGLSDNIDWAAKIWFDKAHGASLTNVLVLAGGYLPETAAQRVEEGKLRGEIILIAFGRWFIANPDLPFRIKNGIQLHKYDRSTFYTPVVANGYIDYPFAANSITAD